jgi:hypothetical protein
MQTHTRTCATRAAHRMRLNLSLWSTPRDWASMVVAAPKARRYLFEGFNHVCV